MSKEPFSLVGLLFGNLGDTLDEETREQLSSWNPNGLFDFNSIGVTEGDEGDNKSKGGRSRLDDGVVQKSADAVDYEDIDEVAEEDASSAAAPQLDSEIANKYYKRALDNIGKSTTTTTTTTTTSSSRDDDNYDDDDSTPSSSTTSSSSSFAPPPPPPSSSSTPSVSAPVPSRAAAAKDADDDKHKAVTQVKKRRTRPPLPLKDKAVSVIPQALQVLFASPDTIDPEEALDPAVRRIAVFSPNGPILKFSELFVYLQNYLSPSRHRRIRLTPPTKPTVNENTLPMELDEEVVFGLGGLQLDRERAEAEAAEREEEEEEDEDVDMLSLPPVSITLPPGVSSPPQSSLTQPETPTQTQPPQPPPLPPKSLFRQSSEITSLVGGVPLWDSKQPLPQVAPVVLSEVTYHPVVLDEWEDKIIWDPPMESESESESEGEDEDEDESDSEGEESAQRVPSIAIEYDRGGKHTKWGVILSNKPKPTLPSSPPVDETPPPIITRPEIPERPLPPPMVSVSSFPNIAAPAVSAPLSISRTPLTITPIPPGGAPPPPFLFQPPPPPLHPSILTAPPPPLIPQQPTPPPPQPLPPPPPSRPPLPPQPELRWSLFPLVNRDLEDGRWLQDVIWDDDSVPHHTPARILDLNDKYMLIEGPREVPPQFPGESDSPQDAIVPDPSDTPESVKRKPKPKPKPKIKEGAPNGVDPNNKENKEEEPQTLRITPTHYGKESAVTEATNLDMFNLSHDEYYSMANSRNRVRHKTSKALVVHSTPAAKLSLVPTHLTREDLQNFHKPRGSFLSGVPYRLAVVTKDRHANGKPKKALNRVDVMKHKSDLSGREGRVIFTEYMEERPHLLENVGMCTRISNFYRKKAPDDTPILSHEDGETILLDEPDDSPFLGDIEPGHSVQALVNNLFKAPIYKHDPANTDFLLVKSKEGKKWYIREMGPVYTVGQLMPLMEVPAPNSRAANQFIKLRMQAFVYRAFMKKSNHQRRLRISDVYTAFPRQTDTAIRKRFQDCADFQRGGDDSGWWTLKESFNLPNEEELQKMVSPEAVCCFEAMLRGQQFLADIGINMFTNVGSIPQALSSLPDSDALKQRAMLLENELQLTPWNLTYNFISAMQGKGRLQLTGPGDPSGRGEAFSYLRMPQKVIQQKQKQLKQNIPKYQVTGTDADLRKLSLENARLVLLRFGVDEEEIQNMTRWDRIAMVRKKSSEAAMQGSEYAMTKFARGSRYSLDHQALMYREQCQAIFDAQMQALADDSLEELEAYGMDLEEMLGADTAAQKNTKRSQQEEEAEEQAERLALAEFLEADKKSNQQQRTPATPTSPALSARTPGTDYSSGEDSDVSVSTHGNDSDTSQSGKKLIIRSTKLITNPDGSQTKVVEFIKDQHLVQEYLRKKRAIDPLRNKITGPLSDEGRKQQQREKRRLQEQLRRLTRNEEKQKSLAAQLKKEGDSSSNAPPVPDKTTQLKCGACGLPGHMRTNRTCPMFIEPVLPSIASPPLASLSPRVKEEAPSQDAAPGPGPLKVEGTKIIFSKKIILSPTAGDSTGLKLRIKNVPLPPKSSSSRKRKYDDDEDSPETPRHSNHRSRIRKGGAGAEVELANLFEKIINHVKALPSAIPFLKPVQAREAPDYKNVIKNPICLTDMRERNRKYCYKTRDALMEDVQLMVDNCHEYNRARNPHLLPVADAVLGAFEDQLREHDADVRKFEEALQAPASPHQAQQHITHSHGPRTPHTPYSPYPSTAASTPNPYTPQHSPFDSRPSSPDPMLDEDHVEII